MMRDESPLYHRMDFLPDEALFEILVSSKGRHAVSKQTLPVGRSILKADPYAMALYPDQFSIRCCHCMKASPAALLRCKTSKILRFCSKDCQKEAWHTSSYRQEMKALAAFSPQVPPATCHLAAKIIWKKLSEKKKTFWESYDAVECLESHWDRLDDERKERFALMAACARDFALRGLDGSEQEAQLMDMAQVARLIARMSCNCHTICDEELRPLGIGLYPIGAMLNHNCRHHNCTQFFGPKGKIDFRTCQEVRPGEELTIAYIDLAATLQERREALAHSYLFDLVPGSSVDLSLSKKFPLRPTPTSQTSFCISGNVPEPEIECSLLLYPTNESSLPPWPQDDIDACLSGVAPEGRLSGGLMVNVVHEDKRSWDLGNGEGLSKSVTEIQLSAWGEWCGSQHVQRVAQDAASASFLLSRCSQSSRDPINTVRSLNEALDLVKNLPLSLHPHHVVRWRIQASLLKALIDEGEDWGWALQVARDLMPVYQIVYPSSSPNYILHLASLAKLESLVGDSSKAIDLARRALSSWQSISPPRSSLLANGPHVEDQLMDLLMGEERVNR
jgi:hypothetical protein